VRSLETGGAEVQLATLAKNLDRDAFVVTVFCFYPKGSLLEELRGEGIRVVSLRKRGRWDLVAFFRRLRAEMMMVQPDVIHSFMGPPNLLAVLLKRSLPETKVIWGIRSSRMYFADYDYSWRIVFALERFLSARADRIVANSFAGCDDIASFGFHPGSLHVVPNGIDVDRFIPSGSARVKLRAEWNVAPDQPLIGLVARLDSKKDHANFLKAAALLAAERTGVRFVCVGADGRQDRRELQAMAQDLGLGERIIWPGYSDRVEAVYPALDVNTLSSAYGEGFPNCIAEAMAAGVPCVVTDVGDSARIVGDYGSVVPPRDPAALAGGWRRLLDLSDDDKESLARNCRTTIQDNYSQSVMVQKMASMYTELANI